jgi:hypothetical protein
MQTMRIKDGDGMALSTVKEPIANIGAAHLTRRCYNAFILLRALPEFLIQIMDKYSI